MRERPAPRLLQLLSVGRLDRPLRPENGTWGRWARFVLRRPAIVAAAGIAVVGALALAGTKLNSNEAQLAKFPGSGTAIAGRHMLADAGIMLLVCGNTVVFVASQRGDDSSCQRC